MINELSQEKIAEWRTLGVGRTSLSIPVRGWTVTLTADRVETLGCQLWEVCFVANREHPDLKKRSEAIAKNVRGLMEPLRVVEVDSLQKLAIVRSDVPTKRNESLFYYEFHLTLDSVLLRRFEKSASTSEKREQVGFALTHEVLTKMIDDVLASSGD